MELSKKTFVVGISGASGSIYGIRLLKALLENPCRIFLIISKSGSDVLKHEFGFERENVPDYIDKMGINKNESAELILCDNDNYFMAPASGSFRHDGMIISPCSMKTLGSIANGMCDNLLTRSADVTLKEKRPLILVPRESPLNLMHIRNMETALLAGATIMPPMMPFYQKTDSVDSLIDTFIGRILDHLRIKHCFYEEWGTY